MTHVVRLLTPADRRVLDRVAPGVFGGPIDGASADEFFADLRHQIVVALEAETVVGFVTAVHHVNPDKPAELWINEIAVAPTHCERGIGTELLRRMLQHGRAMGCRDARVLTDGANEPANKLYRKIGGKRDDGETVVYSFDLTGDEHAANAP